MTQTDRILGNIGAIITMIKTFPMGFFKGKGDSYNSSFEFIMDILRICGVSDRQIVDFIISKIYGFENSKGFTINGLYEEINRNDFTIQPNQFINTLENSIKTILMALFTSVYTCSALPILPNSVFDLNTSINGLMSSEIQNFTKRNGEYDYHLRIPIPSIDLLGMLSISPVTSTGRLYYMVEGYDKYYHKEIVTEKYFEEEIHYSVLAGEHYTEKINKFNNEYEIRLIYNETEQNKVYIYFGLYEETNNLCNSPIDIDIKISYIEPNVDSVHNETVTIKRGEQYTENIFISDVIQLKSTSIRDITFNKYHKGFEINENNGKSWIYFSESTGSTHYNASAGSKIPETLFGGSRINEQTTIDKIATENIEDGTVMIEKERKYLSYRLLEENETKPRGAVRYSYVPDSINVTSGSPEYIVCYNGPSPNLLYRSYDMNAFIWFCLNRGNFSKQIEENHLMWDSRRSASENSVSRNSSEDWNKWYSSKLEEGGEFSYNGHKKNEMLYPIIQVEKGEGNNIVVRIPSQRYFLPIKRKMILNEESTSDKTFFNASIYKFDWEYLKNIQILNPKLMLVRLIEHLLGLSMDVTSNTKIDYTKKKIEQVLSKAVKSMIMADDMEVEDCWKSFSNDDFNELLEEMEFARYTSSKYNGEVTKARNHNIQDYVNTLNDINSTSQTQGTTTKITKMVTDIMVAPGIEPSTEWSFDYNFDSNMLNRLIWAIVMPIVESLFTPQVMLLMMINFQLLGIVNVQDTAFGDLTGIMNFLMNKILGLVNSIVLFVKDEIVKLLYNLLKEEINPILIKYSLMLFLEKITDWLVVLTDAVRCIQFRDTLSEIDDVDYADIVKEKAIPSSGSEC